VKAIVADALERDREERAAFLAEACAGDAGLRAEVETLLRADEPGGGFLDLDRRPEQIGPYRIAREIGRGGMGTVYLGERADGQFDQRVAIKVIKRGMDTDAVLRRFLAERQILARLQHPNITRLFDGGMYDGRPYFVMEYLEGEPIAPYCARRGLGVEERARLFLAVCDAVEYAHRNLVLHRDLKAGNILVDTSGSPKLLDFGIAKLLGEQAEGATTAAWRPLTPQAASPEQFRGEPLTTASDVYSLGLLLFELLAGSAPYQVSGLPPREMARVICETAPPRPSSVAGDGPSKKLRGDLDNIVLRALEKEPARRYQGAAELGEDLRRWLAGLPVQARPQGASYRARKFVARHRKALAVTAAVVLAISAAVGDAVMQGRRAKRRFEDLRQLAGAFLFEFYDAIQNLPGATPARELVMRRGIQYLDSLAREASGDTGLKRELAEGYVRIGMAQGLYFDSNLGKRDAARESFAKAVALLEDVTRREPSNARARAELARALLGMATTYQGQDHSAQSLAYEQRVIGMLERAANAAPLTVEEQRTLGSAYNGLAETRLTQGRDADAVAARLRSVEILQAALKPAPEDETERLLAQSEKRLAYIYLVRLHDPGKAVEPLRMAMSIDEGLVARNPRSATAKLDLARDRSYFASMLERRGDREAARRMLEGVIAMRREALAMDPQNAMLRPALLADYSKLAGLLQGREARDAAIAGLGVAHDLEGSTDDSVKSEMARLRKVAGQ
jgi:non-specific serine/threonine protein kinase/serine/threonine-protein kinase